jgi:hypothetical protein
MPWKQHSVSDWERKVHELQMKLLAANAQLRLKTIYAERLEVLIHERCNRIDALFHQLELAHAANHKLKLECERLAHIITASPHPARITAS